jgi:hypothetical protein
MELTLERYLNEDGLREKLERRARRERAELMHHYLAAAARALRARTAPAPAPVLRIGDCA